MAQGEAKKYGFSPLLLTARGSRHFCPGAGGEAARAPRRTARRSTGRHCGGWRPGGDEIREARWMRAACAARACWGRSRADGAGGLVRVGRRKGPADLGRPSLEPWRNISVAAEAKTKKVACVGACGGGERKKNKIIEEKMRGKKKKICEYYRYFTFSTSRRRNFYQTLI